MVGSAKSACLTNPFQTPEEKRFEWQLTTSENSIKFENFSTFTGLKQDNLPDHLSDKQYRVADMNLWNQIKLDQKALKWAIFFTLVLNILKLLMQSF